MGSYHHAVLDPPLPGCLCSLSSPAGALCAPGDPCRALCPCRDPAEPYVHQEVPAEPYYGGEPTGYAGPAWTGGCVNNLGQGVPCRNLGEEEAVQSLDIDWP